METINVTIIAYNILGKFVSVTTKIFSISIIIVMEKLTFLYLIEHA